MPLEQVGETAHSGAIPTTTSAYTAKPVAYICEQAFDQGRISAFSKNKAPAGEEIYLPGAGSHETSTDLSNCWYIIRFGSRLPIRISHTRFVSELTEYNAPARLWPEESHEITQLLLLFSKDAIPRSPEEYTTLVTARVSRIIGFFLSKMDEEKIEQFYDFCFRKRAR